MAEGSHRDRLEKALESGGGILRLQPAWVARDFLPAGRRLGLPDDAYDVGERGHICERWLGSTTEADNAVGPPNEGLSFLELADGFTMSLRDAVDEAPEAILGAEYARSHGTLGRLPKLFDYAARLPLHLHQRQCHADLVGRHSKDEAYYFPPDVDMGPHPETFLGVHPHIADEGCHEVLLPYLEDWDSDLILRHSPAYLQVPEEGFFVPSGVLHAPGSALTIELQEDSDVFAMLQALNEGRIISKELLWKDVSAQDRESKGERFILELIDWKENGDPHFFKNHHLIPLLIEDSVQDAGEEYWIFYGSTKFVGKKLRVRPGGTYRSVDAGVHSILAWQGTGTVGGHDVEGRNPGRDELLIVHDRAAAGVDIVNTGSDDLTIIKFFGPDMYPVPEA